jgi:lysophospholipase L1-like esterase
MLRSTLCVALFLAALAAFALMRGPAQSAAERACTIPDEWALSELRLPATRASLAHGGPIRIAALGAASTAGAAAGAGYTYPDRLAARLAAALGGTAVTVLNEGVRGQTVEDMAARLEREIISEGVSLVIWEVGTVEAARSLDLETLGENLTNGMGRLKAAGIDIILMDMQYAPSTSAVIDYDRYLELVHQAADNEGVPVYHRFEIMRAWNEAGVLDLDNYRPKDRPELARELYDCLAAGLADGIAKALR